MLSGSAGTGFGDLDPENLFQRSELLFSRIEGEYPAVSYVVDPAVQADRPGGEARGYGGMGSECWSWRRTFSSIKAWVM